MTTSMILPWSNWEDYAAGLYEHRFYMGQVQASVKLLSDPDEFAAAAREMVREWPHAADHNLHLPSGRRAWIGQAACCYHHGATAEETAGAWGRLSNQVQRRANAIASIIAKDYLDGRGPGAETLFDG
jgi:hypothetical protein